MVVVNSVLLYLLAFMFLEMDVLHWTWLPTTTIIMLAFMWTLREVLVEYVNTNL